MSEQLRFVIVIVGAVVVVVAGVGVTSAGKRKWLPMIMIMTLIVYLSHVVLCGVCSICVALFGVVTMRCSAEPHNRTVFAVCGWLAGWLKGAHAPA